MKKIFSTVDVPPRERFDYWHSIACQHIVGHSSIPECRETFAAEIETGSFGEIGLVSFSNAPMCVDRASQHIAQATSDELFICRQAAGVLNLNQEGRTVVLGSGDMSLLDPLLPYRASFSGESRLLVAKVGRRELEARIGRSRDLTAFALKPTEPINRWISSNLTMLPGMVGRLTPAAEAMASSQTFDLIAAALLSGKQRISASGKTSARFQTLLKVKSAIENHLADPRLDASMVSEAAGVSIRYANDLLAKEHTSIKRLVLSLRLARCRAAFEDPLQNHRPVAEIARSWGFRDMTHFGRCFRAAFNVLPRDYRRSASGAGQR